MTSDSAGRSRTPTPHGPPRAGLQKKALAVYAGLPEFGDVVREALEREGHPVFSTGDLRAFAAHLRRHPKTLAVVCLVATELGHETLALLRADPALRELKLLQVGQRWESPTLADAQLVVPFHLEDLLEVIERLTAG